MIYIATPHRGSRIDSGAVRRSGRGWFSCPTPCSARRRLVAENPPDFFREPFRKVLPSSIDELEWESPILTGVSELAHPPALKVHSIIAVRADSPPGDRTDGVVSYESAHVAGAASEKLVTAGHLCQDSLEVISEVRRILLEHAGLPEPPGRPSYTVRRPRSNCLLRWIVTLSRNKRRVLTHGGNPILVLSRRFPHSPLRKRPSA